MAHQIFLLSPARCDGARARMLLNPTAEFPLALQLRTPEGAPLGEVFSFLSGLYFRGKITYAQAFSRAPQGAVPIHIITTDRGLVPPETRVHRDDLLAFSDVDLAMSDDRFLSPLRRDAAAIERTIGEGSLAVLLGSIATEKYAGPLMATFGERLVFPAEFVGRGDMSRGGLLLRQARADQELEYVPVAGAIRHGRRPAKLERLR